jgi:hypothetical protein
MSCSDDSNSTDPKRTPNPRPDPAESAGPTGWLDALDSFPERAFLKADRGANRVHIGKREAGKPAVGYYACAVLLR